MEYFSEVKDPRRETKNKKYPSTFPLYLSYLVDHLLKFKKPNRKWEVLAFRKKSK
jgi:hypothetical protein